MVDYSKEKIYTLKMKSKVSACVESYEANGASLLGKIFKSAWRRK